MLFPEPLRPLPALANFQTYLTPLDCRCLSVKIPFTHPSAPLTRMDIGDFSFLCLIKVQSDFVILDVLAKRTKYQTNRSLTGSDGSNSTRHTTSVIEEIRSHRGAFSVSRLSVLIGITPKTAYRFISNGTLPHFKFGTSIRLDPKVTAEWLEQCWMGV